MGHGDRYNFDRSKTDFAVGALAALKLRRAEQESRQQLILFFDCIRRLLLGGLVWCGWMSRGLHHWNSLGIALRGLGLRVLGLGILGSLLIELDLRIKLNLIINLVQQSFSRVLAEATGYELRFEALLF